MAINTKVDMLSQKLDCLLSIGQIPRQTNSPQTFQDVCALCSIPYHYMSDYPLAVQFPEYVQEQAQAAQSFSKLGNDPFSNTYIPSWRNHLNFGWKQPNGFQTPPNKKKFSNQQNIYRDPQQPLPPSQLSSSIEEKVLRTLKGLDQNIQLLHSHTQSLSKLETQLGQLTDAISRREEGQLPSQVIDNPNNQPSNRIFHEQAKAVMTLRSGRVFGIPKKRSLEESSEKEASPEAPQVSKDHEIEQVGEGNKTDSYIPKAPFPSCLNSPSSSLFAKKGAEMGEIMELFKQVQINLPLLGATKQVSAYAKFLKDLCTQKRKLKTHIPKTIHLTEQVSAILFNQLSPKLKDPGAPLISCTIGNISIERVLLDLRASVNLLPSSVLGLES
ncbi:uncharacterized protein LOC122672185 [Telopea speciosissima]|uniref:uncharacterized protein LOC122672185 n=1 Tax=Telopea speciosissima TaxID=54955 RepID=UPI001CC336C3|nr:uncharacterized protein LOC122672185 [Telopea speciosissima]